MKLECIEIQKCDGVYDAGITQMVYNEKPFGLYIETGNINCPVSFEISNEKVLIDFFNELKQHKLNDGKSLFFISDNNCIYLDREFFAKYNSNSIVYEDEEDLGCFFQYITSLFDK